MKGRSKKYRGTMRRIGYGCYRYRTFNVERVSTATRDYWAGTHDLDRGLMFSEKRREEVAIRIDQHLDGDSIVNLE